MDDSKTRRGQPCWYRFISQTNQTKVGLVAINDSFLLESMIYKVIKKYFRNTPYYVDVLDLFHEVTYQTELGQLMDLLTAPEDHVDLSKFSIRKYARFCG
jgi:farnesyl diphosphate synthase